MKVGVIGSGAISDIYLSNMIEKFDNLEVICIASKHPEHAKAKAEKYNIAACSVEELLENPEVEMVVNLTPASVHYELIKKALLAGKHVYTEKTMTDEVNKAKELVELAEEKGLYLGSAPDTFLGAALQTARRAIDDGILGEIHSFAISANRNNDLLLSVFSFLRQPGGGILYDYGVYYLTALTSLFGSVKRVGSVIGRPYPTHVNIMPMSPEFGQVMDTPNESQVSAVLVMENGVTGTLHIDADSHFADQSYFAVYGTKGILYLTDPNGFGGQVRFLPNPANPMKPEPETVLWNFSPYEENSVESDLLRWPTLLLMAGRTEPRKRWRIMCRRCWMLCCRRGAGSVFGYSIRDGASRASAAKESADQKHRSYVFPDEKRGRDAPFLRRNSGNEKIVYADHGRSFGLCAGTEEQRRRLPGKRTGRFRRRGTKSGVEETTGRYETDGGPALDYLYEAGGPSVSGAVS